METEYQKQLEKLIDRINSDIKTSNSIVEHCNIEIQTNTKRVLFESILRAKKSSICNDLESTPHATNDV